MTKVNEFGNMQEEVVAMYGRVVLVNGAVHNEVRIKERVWILLHKTLPRHLLFHILFRVLTVLFRLAHVDCLQSIVFCNRLMPIVARILRNFTSINFISALYVFCLQFGQIVVGSNEVVEYLQVFMLVDHCVVTMFSTTMEKNLDGTNAQEWTVDANLSIRIYYRLAFISRVDISTDYFLYKNLWFRF